MSATSRAVADPLSGVRSERYATRVWAKYRRNRSAMIGLIGVAGIVAAALLGPLVLSWAPDVPNPEALLQSPSLSHPFGTDQLGRDLLARTLAGARVSLVIALVTSFVALIVGITYGAVSGWAGARLDNAMMRIVDVLYSFPDLLLVIIVSLVVGRGVPGMIVALSTVSWITVARIVRGEVRALKVRPFVEAARAVGSPQTRILGREILPNLISPVLITLTFRIPSVILAESTLSFIGLGLQPPASSWGVLAAEGWQALTFYPHLILFPSLAIFVTILGFNLVGEGLREAV